MEILSLFPELFDKLKTTPISSKNVKIIILLLKNIYSHLSILI